MQDQFHSVAPGWDSTTDCSRKHLPCIFKAACERFVKHKLKGMMQKVESWTSVASACESKLEVFRYSHQRQQFHVNPQLRNQTGYSFKTKLVDATDIAWTGTTAHILLLNIFAYGMDYTENSSPIVVRHHFQDRSPQSTDWTNTYPYVWPVLGSRELIYHLRNYYSRASKTQVSTNKTICHRTL